MRISMFAAMVWGALPFLFHRVSAFLPLQAAHDLPFSRGVLLRMEQDFVPRGEGVVVFDYVLEYFSFDPAFGGPEVAGHGKNVVDAVSYGTAKFRHRVPASSKPKRSVKP